MTGGWPVTRLAGHAVLQSSGLEFVDIERSRSVASEAQAGFRRVDAPPRRSLQVLWNPSRVTCREVEALNARVITDMTLVKFIALLVNVRLTEAPCAECPNQFMRDRLLAIADRVSTLIASCRERVVVGP